MFFSYALKKSYYWKKFDLKLNIIGDSCVMYFLRKHIILLRLFWFLMGIHIINFSIDSPDKYSDDIPEDLSYNDMESFFEIFIENFLGYENAVEEYDEDDTDAGGSVSISKIVFFSDFQYLKTPNFRNRCFYTISKLTLYKDASYIKFHPEVIPPPPKS